MNIVFGILIGLLILMALVVLHEFGHFIMARKSGVRVKEFGIGFPPRAVAWVKREVEVTDKDGEKVKKQKWVRFLKEDWGKEQDTLIFSLNWLPIGGFCAMDGESDADTRKGTFGAASFWAKTKILFGGVLMNWLTAIVILTILAWTGMPQFIENQFNIPSDARITGEGVTVSEVLNESPAQRAGFQTGDKIVKVGEETVYFPAVVINYGKENAGKTGRYEVERDGETKVMEVELNDETEKYTLGVAMDYGQSYIHATWSAPIGGIATTVQLTGETFKGLGEMIGNTISGLGKQFSADDKVREEGKAEIEAAGDSVSGPVGIVGVLFPSIAQTGLTNVMFLAALIAVSLACMNMLPIPALDGGRWLMIAISRLRGKPLTKETEDKIVSRAFMVLIALVVLITVLDVVKIIWR